MLDSILLANHVLKTWFLGWNWVCKSRVPALKNQRPFSTSFYLLLLQLKNHDPSTNIKAALRIKLKKEEEGRIRERERKQRQTCTKKNNHLLNQENHRWFATVMRTSGTLMQAPRAYKAWVGGLLRRCGTRSLS